MASSKAEGPYPVVTDEVEGDNDDENVEAKLLKLPDSIGWRASLRSGWKPDAGESAFQFYSREVLLGIIICMAQIPESIAFAYLARVRPPVALHAAWVIGVICSAIGGRPGMVNGATGAFAAIVATFLEEPEKDGGNGAGVELLFPSVMLAGVLMLCVWALRLDRFISLLPLPVMVGFCNGLAIVIGRAQLHPFNAPVCGEDDHGSTGRLLSASGDCTDSGYKEGAELGFMILIMLTAMLIMELVPKIPKPSLDRGRNIVVRVVALVANILLELPSSMLSIIASILLEFALIRPLGFKTDTIGDKEKFTARDALPRPFFLDDFYDMNKYGDDGAIGKVIVQGILLCAVGCIESLMTAEVVSGFTKTSHHSGLVVGAMGVGNIISGFLGGMGGNAMIGLSTIACLNGGKGRIAPLATAVGILICVSCAYQVLNFIPMAALAGIMIVVVLHTFKWFSLPMLAAALLSKEKRELVAKSLACCPTLSVHRKVIRSDVVIMIVVSVLVVISNIVVAVGVGLALACAAYAWQSSQALTVVAYTMTAPAAPGGGGQPETIKVYEVDGPLFFAVTKAFGDYFTPEDDPERVICTFTRGGELHDYTMMDAMVGLTAAYKAEGKKIEFHSLKSSSIKMLTKAKYWTKEVVYVQESVDEHTNHGAVDGSEYSRHAHIKRRITGLNAPSWTNAPGPGTYGLTATSAPIEMSATSQDNV